MQGGLIETTRFVSSGIGDGDAEDLEAGVSGLSGVRDVVVNGDDHSVTVRFDPTQVDENLIRERIESLGYSISDTSDQMTDASDPAGYGAEAPLT